MRETSLWVSAAIAFIALAPVRARADVLSLDLQTMVHRYADVVVAGEIVAVTYSELPLDDGYPAAYTNLHVRGRNLYTGESQTVVASFVGGYLESGQRVVTSVEPTVADTRIGNKVVVFTAPWAPQPLWNAPERSLVASYAGIFQVQPGPQGDVVIGKGDRTAIPRNVFLADLEAQVRDLWRTRPR